MMMEIVDKANHWDSFCTRHYTKNFKWMITLNCPQNVQGSIINPTFQMK